MVTITAATLAWAQDAFMLAVENLLDDPSGVCEQDDPKAYIDELRAIGKDLDMDFDEVAQDVGSPYEIQRLWSLM